MAPHSSVLAWKIPWMEEPGRLQSMGSLRVRHDWVTSLSLSLIGEGNGSPLLCSCLESPRDGGAWWAAVYGVAQSQTRLKRLSSRSNWSINVLFLHHAPPLRQCLRFDLHQFISTVEQTVSTLPLSTGWWEDHGKGHGWKLALPTGKYKDQGMEEFHSQLGRGNEWPLFC